MNQPHQSAAPASGLVPTGASTTCEAPAFPTELRALEARALSNHRRMDAISALLSELTAEYRSRLEDDLRLSMRIDHLKARLRLSNI